jgi:hypothetical protein
MVEVAFVDVALNAPNVGVEVATTKPEEFVERIELVATPERVKEEVAVIAPPTKRLPEKYPLPITSSLLFGVVVPMPMLPALVTRISSVLLF